MDGPPFGSAAFRRMLLIPSPGSLGGCSAISNVDHGGAESKKAREVSEGLDRTQ